jgi:CheY-like chemotaxis protein
VAAGEKAHEYRVRRLFSQDGDVNSHGKGLRVLVAEDHTDSREMIACFLRQRGCSVRAVADGVEAVAAARSFLPELILLDVWMPRLNGVDTCHILRGEVLPQRPLICAVTADATPRHPSRTCFDEILLKPADFAILGAVIDRCVALVSKRLSPDIPA